MKAIELDHPLIEHKLSILRDKKTGTKEFRELIKEIAMFLCYEAMKDVKLVKTTIETPIQKMNTHKLDEDKYAFVPILRAGMGMLEGVITVVPNAKIGHIGMYRDEETFVPVNYFFKVPKDIEKREVFLLDPMLATGGSAIDAIDLLKSKGVKKIKFLCIIAAPEGIKAMQEKHPDVKIYCAKVDNYLNEKIATDFIFINHGEIISEMTSEEFSNANKGYVQLEVNDTDSFKRAMEDLKIPYEEEDNFKMNVFSNDTITDLIIRLNSYGCIVTKCFNVETSLEEFFIRLMDEDDK